MPVPSARSPSAVQLLEHIFIFISERYSRFVPDFGLLSVLLGRWGRCNNVAAAAADAGTFPGRDNEPARAGQRERRICDDLLETNIH